MLKMRSCRCRFLLKQNDPMSNDLGHDTAKFGKEARDTRYNPGKQNQEKKDPFVLLSLSSARQVVVMMLTASK